MRFTSPDARPALTPLGHRLLHLSEQKLAYLDGSFYDEGPALLKGVLVREAVRSAWRSVADGAVVEMTDWSARGAMGLDVVDEMDEEQQDEETWFEDLVSSFGEEEAYSEGASGEHEWVDSSVSMPEYDIDFDVNGMEAFTFPLPTSPPAIPAADDRAADGRVSLASLPTVSVTGVDVVEVDDESDLSDDDAQYLAESIHWPARHRHIPSSTITFTSTTELASPSTPTLLGYPSSPLLAPLSSSTLPPPSPFPLSPSASPALGEFVLPDPRSYYTEFEEYVDEFTLPPPLLRSLSWSSASSEDGEVCRTPPLRGEEVLDEEVVEGKRGSGAVVGEGSGGQGEFGLGLVFDGLRI
ncbi:hypothetical protein IAT38_000795 [Cryptococcus sp. DSM 104549]